MTPSIEELMARSERSIKISLGGPLAERRMRAAMASARPDGGGWCRHYDPQTPTACHEAGHLIVCAALGEPFVWVSIRPLPNSGGRLVRGNDPVAPDHDAPPGTSDRIQIVNRMRLLWLGLGSPGWREMLAVIRRLRAETNQLLDRYWLYVETVTNRLLVRLQMDRAEVETLLVGLRRGGSATDNEM